MYNLTEQISVEHGLWGWTDDRGFDKVFSGTEPEMEMRLLTRQTTMLQPMLDEWNGKCVQQSQVLMSRPSWWERKP